MVEKQFQTNKVSIVSEDFNRIMDNNNWMVNMLRCKYKFSRSVNMCQGYPV